MGKKSGMKRDELLARIESGKEVWRQDQARIAELVTQRDELLEALKTLCTLDAQDSSTEWNSAFKKGESAIAKVEGEKT